MTDSALPDRQLERLLRSSRPQARAAFLDSLPGSRGRSRLAPFRARPVLGLVAATGTLAVASGLGWAAHTAIQAVEVRVHRVAPDDPRAVVIRTPGGDQYSPALARVPEVAHPGPPRLQLAQGPVQAVTLPPAGTAAAPVRLTSSVGVDESAVLELSLVDAEGRAVLLDRATSSLDGLTFRGRPAASLRFNVRKPRRLAVDIRVVAGQLRPGETYTLVVVATDRSGDTATQRAVLASVA